MHYEVCNEVTCDGAQLKEMEPFKYTKLFQEEFYPPP